MRRTGRIRRSIEIRRIGLPAGDLEYRLQRSSARRTLALTVREACLVVQAPWGVPAATVESVLRAREGWIRDRLAVQAIIVRPDWQPGMRLDWLGRSHALVFDPRAKGVEADGDTLRVAAAGPEQARRRVLEWYRQQAGDCFARRVVPFLPRLARPPASLRLTSARTRWGSCTAAGVVRVNWRLMQATPAEIDYVLAHELAHLAHLDHSTAFWQEVERLMPEYRSARSRLQVSGYRYQQISL